MLYPSLSRIKLLSLTGSLVLLSSAVMAAPAEHLSDDTSPFISSSDLQSSTALNPTSSSLSPSPKPSSSSSPSHSTSSSHSSVTTSTHSTSSHSSSSSHTVTPTSSSLHPSSSPTHSTTSSLSPTPSSSPTPPPKPSLECALYSESGRKQEICDAYNSDNTFVVEHLPEKPAKNSLYIVNSTHITVEAPYVVPPSTSILPAPALSEDNIAPLNITAAAGTGSNDKCDHCLLILSEKSKVAGVTLKAWNIELEGIGHTQEKERSLIYGETTDSEVSESVLEGNSHFTNVIHQKLTTDEDMDTAQRYFNIFVALNGSENGLLVENADGQPVEQSDDAQSTPWDLYTSAVVEMSGSVSEGVNVQRALSFINIRPQIGQSSLIFGDNLPKNAMYERQAIYMKDTTRASLYLNRPVSRLKEERVQDVQFFVEGENAKSIDIYTGGNSYSWLATGFVAAVGDISTTLYKGPEVATIDLPAVNLTDYQQLMSYSQSMGVYQGSVIELEAFFKRYSGGHFNASSPLIMTKPVNMTGNFTVVDVTDPQTYKNMCSSKPWYGHWQTWATVCGASVGTGATVLVIAVLVARKIFSPVTSSLSAGTSSEPLMKD